MSASVSEVSSSHEVLSRAARIAAAAYHVTKMLGWDRDTSAGERTCG